MKRTTPSFKRLGAVRGARRASLAWGLFWLGALLVLVAVASIFYQLSYSPGALGSESFGTSSAPVASPSLPPAVSVPLKKLARALPKGWGESQKKALRSLVAGGGGENATMVVFQTTW